MPEQQFDAGHVFFHTGDPADHAYLLADGQVELVADSAGPASRVRLLAAGDVFGEMALIEERPRAFTARAVTPVRATPMTRDEFEYLLTHEPARARNYLRSLFERLRVLTTQAASDPVAPPADEAAAPAATGWTVVLRPLTPAAGRTLADTGLTMTTFPQRIGRVATGHEPEPLDLNDVWLLDDKPHTVSRNHCEIYLDHDGPAVRDRGSQLGCVVNDENIGGRTRRGSVRLRPGDNTLILGSRTSPFQFRLTVSHA